MSSPNLSPEEILRKKEMQSGISFDDPIQDLPPVETIAPEPIPVEKPAMVNQTKQVEPEKVLEPVPLVKQDPPSMQSGWKNLPVKVLPTGGDFYPDGTQIAIRPAEVKEIRHFSSIDETDMLDIDSKLNMILDSCCTMQFPGEGVVSYKDLKQEDRFFIIMAIRDLTFIKGENRIILSPKTNCGKDNCSFKYGVELRTGVLTNYQIDSKIYKYYSKSERKFIFTLKKNGKQIKMSIPSIGVLSAITEYVRNSVRTGKEVDESFIKIAPFVFDEWRNLTEKEIDRVYQESINWSKEEFSIYYEMTNLIKIGTKLEISLPCEQCGAREVTAPISFPGGFRSLFVISDIFGELL